MEIMQTDPELHGRPNSYDDSSDRLYSPVDDDESQSGHFSGSGSLTETSERVDICGKYYPKWRT